jgi:hypothetical protein
MIDDSGSVRGSHLSDIKDNKVVFEENESHVTRDDSLIEELLSEDSPVEQDIPLPGGFAGSVL